MPSVGLQGLYNKRWNVDVVTLQHNAIRFHLSDMFGYLISMRSMALDLTEEEFQR